VFAAPKSIQATVTLLENLHIILEKTPPEDVRTEVLPMLFNAFESSTLQVQVSLSFLLISCAPDFPLAQPAGITRQRFLLVRIAKMALWLTPLSLNQFATGSIFVGIK
jgi:hypothetical protein